MSRSIFTKHFILFVLLFTIGFISVLAVSLSFYIQFYDKEKQDTLYNITMRISKEIEYNFQVSTESFFKSLNFTETSFNANFMVIDSSGNLITENNEDLNKNLNIITEIFNKSDTKQVLGSIVEKTSDLGTLLSSFNVNSNNSKYYCYQISNEIYMQNTSKYYYLVGFMRDSARSQLVINYIEIIGLIFILIISVVIIFNYVISKKIMNKLHKIAKITYVCSKGDYSNRIPVSEEPEDELDEISKSVNILSQRMDNIDDMIKTFISNISHEFRNPMTSISGFINGIIDGTIPENKREHYLYLISNEIMRINRFINVMSDTIKIQSNIENININKFDLIEAFNSAVLHYQKILNEKNIKLKLDTPEKEVIVNADKTLLKEALLCIIDNAVKFSSDNSDIDVIIGCDEDSTFITVKNYGIGIKEDEKLKIFDRFYKTDFSRAKNSETFGLGLYIVHTIIVMFHEGEIKIESEPDEFFEITVKIPINE